MQSQTAIAGNASEPQTAPDPDCAVWQIEKTSGRRSSVTSLPSNAVLEGVSGPNGPDKARPKAGPDPIQMPRAPCWRPPRRRDSPCEGIRCGCRFAPPKRWTTPTARPPLKTLRGWEYRDELDDATAPAQVARAPPAPAARSWLQVLARGWLTRRWCVYHLPGLADRYNQGQESKWLAEYPFMRRCRERGVRRRDCVC